MSEARDRERRWPWSSTIRGHSISTVGSRFQHLTASHDAKRLSSSSYQLVRHAVEVQLEGSHEAQEVAVGTERKITAYSRTIKHY